MTEKEVANLIELLNKCEPGQLPDNVFTAIARLTVSPSVELIPLRQNNGTIEVMLLPRPADDPVWPGKLHTPGTILRPSDESFQDAIDRLYRTEIKVNPTDELIFIGSRLGKGERGTGVSFEYLVDFSNVEYSENFYDCNHLPENFMDEQKHMLENAFKQFQALFKQY